MTALFFFLFSFFKPDPAGRSLLHGRQAERWDPGRTRTGFRVFSGYCFCLQYHCLGESPGSPICDFPSRQTLSSCKMCEFGLKCRGHVYILNQLGFLMVKPYLLLNKAVKKPVCFVSFKKGSTRHVRMFHVQMLSRLSYHGFVFVLFSVVAATVWYVRRFI